MKSLIVAFLFSTGAFAQTITCDVNGVRRGLVINLSDKLVQIKALAQSNWNGEAKAYKILNIRENGDLIQGIQFGSADPTIMEVFLSRKLLRVGTIIYVGHRSQMQFGTYQEFNLSSCF